MLIAPQYYGAVVGGGEVDEAILVKLVEVGDGLAVRIELDRVSGLDGHALLAACLL